MTFQGNPRYYQIIGRLETKISYGNMLPEDQPQRLSKEILPQSQVRINYDCYDRVGELYLDGHSATIPFPTLLQGVHTEENGDYHIIKNA